MSYFLWVEDFDNNTKVTASSVLGKILDENVFDENKRTLKKRLKEYGVFIELNFQDGLEFITSNLNKVDYIILDIDLPAYDDEINPEVLKLLETFEDYQPHKDDEAEDEERRKKACDKLKKIAGFHLYTKLVVDLGFPKQHILFCSNHADEMKTVQQAFQDAKINLPKLYFKYDSDVKEWVKKCYENPYSILRRGIIEGCRHLKELSNDKHRFNEFIHDREKQFNEEVLRDYLEVLENFLPLREPENTEVRYKLFIRTLAHEWEATKWESAKFEKPYNRELYAFYWIMRMTRNWSAHSKIFEQLTSQDVAYLFIINMRTMFDLGETLLPYEKHLLRLFTDVISDQEMKRRIGENPKSRDIPLIENYAALLDKMGNTWQAINFHNALNNLQKNHDKENESNFFIKGLYQSFWFLTSTGRVYLPRENNELHLEQIQKFSVLNYQFKYVNYKKPEYLFEIARHIYKSSFPEA